MEIFNRTCLNSVKSQKNDRFQLISIYFQLMFNLLSIDVQLILIDFQLISIYFQFIYSQLISIEYHGTAIGTSQKSHKNLIEFLQESHRNIIETSWNSYKNAIGIP